MQNILKKLKLLLFIITLGLAHFQSIAMESAIDSEKEITNGIKVAVPPMPSFPSLVETQSLITEKGVKKIIAQHLLMPEAKAFIKKRLTPARARLNKRTFNKVIPLSNRTIAIVESNVVAICSHRSWNPLRTISLEKYVAPLVVKRNKAGSKLVVKPSVLDATAALSVLNVHDGSHLHSFLINKGEGCNSVQFRAHKSGEFLIAASKNTVKMWSIDTGDLCSSIEIPDSNISYIKTDSHAKKIVIGLQQGNAQLWDLRKATLLHTLDDSKYAVKAKFSPDGQYVVIYSTLHHSALYEVKSGKRFYKLDRAVSKNLKISWNAQSTEILIVGASDKKDHFASWLHIDKAKESAHVRSLVNSGKNAFAAFIPGSDTIVYAKKNVATLWQPGPHKYKELKGHEKAIKALACNKDGCKILTHSTGTIKVWDVKTGLCLYDLRTHHVNSLFLEEALISYDEGSRVSCYYLQELEDLFNDLTFEQTFLINAIYEIILLRRLASIRGAASAYRAFKDNSHIKFLNEALTTAFSKKLIKSRSKLADLFLEIKAQPIPITTIDGALLEKGNLVFDFTTKDQSLLASYKSLHDLIHIAFAPYVKLSATDVPCDTREPSEHEDFWQSDSFDSEESLGSEE